MAAEKFMFERSFDMPGPAKASADVEEIDEVEEEPEIVLPTFSEEEMEAARAEGIEQGKEEALKESATAIESQIVEATKQIGVKLDTLIHEQKAANRDIFVDAIKISQALTKKMFPTINIDQGLPEIERILQQILVQVIEEPRVTIQVHPNIEPLLAERIDQIASETHFEGRLHITGKEAVAEGDCKIEWSNGGAERNLETLLMEADAIIDANLESLKGDYVPSQEAYDLESEKNPPPASPGSGESPSPSPSQTPETPDASAVPPSSDSTDTAPKAAEPAVGSQTEPTAASTQPNGDKAQISADAKPPAETTEAATDQASPPDLADDDSDQTKNSDPNPSGSV